METESRAAWIALLERTLAAHLTTIGAERSYPSGRTDPDCTIPELRPGRALGWYRARPFALDSQP